MWLSHLRTGLRMTYLDSITLTKSLPCLVEPGRIIVIGQPSQTLGEVLPYLATLPGIIAWNPNALTLTFRRPHGFMTLDNDKVYITQVVDSHEGLELFAALKDAINTVWEKRAELLAVTVTKNAPRHLDLWRVLPQTNCGQCGESTCLAFAVALVQHTRTLTECPILKNDSHFADRRAALEALLG
jgi:ArsR family metal-binding transcriptional regulator